MKDLIITFLPLMFTAQAWASVPYCNIAEIYDGSPTLQSNVVEFKKTEKLEISMKDDSARGTAEWNSAFKFYQMNMWHGTLMAITIVEPPGISGFINLQDGNRIFQMQCRFELP